MTTPSFLTNLYEQNHVRVHFGYNIYKRVYISTNVTTANYCTNQHNSYFSSAALYREHLIFNNNNK